MAEPGNTPSPFDPTPFRPAAAQPGPGGSSGGAGCRKSALVGCGALLVLLGIAAIVFIANAKRIMPAFVRWSFTRLEAQVLTQMPADSTAEERARLQRAFDGAIAAIASGKADPQQLQPVQAQVMDIAQKSQEKLTHADIRSLTEALEGLAGTPAPSSPSPPEHGTEPESSEPQTSPQA